MPDTPPTPPPGLVTALLGKDNAQALTSALVSSGPYFTAISTIATVCSTINTMGWQHSTMDQLNRILSAISDLENEVSNLSKQISELPIMFSQITEEEYLKEVSGLIEGYHSLINSRIQGKPGHSLSKDDTKAMFDAANELIVRAGSLNNYGSSAYPIVALAVSYFLLAATAAQERYTRNDIINFLSEKISYFMKLVNDFTSQIVIFNGIADDNFNYISSYYPKLIFMGLANWPQNYKSNLNLTESPYDPSLGLIYSGNNPPKAVSALAIYLDLSQFSIASPPPPAEPDWSYSDAFLGQLTIVKTVNGPPNTGPSTQYNPLDAPTDPHFTFFWNSKITNHGTFYNGPTPPTYRQRVADIIVNLDKAKSIYFPAHNASLVASGHLFALKSIIQSLTTWLPLSQQAIGGIPAVVLFQKQLFVAFKGIDDSLYITSSAEGVSFAKAKGFSDILLGSDPAMAATENGLFIAFKAHDASDSLWVTSSKDGVNFAPAKNYPDILLGSPPAMAATENGLFIAFKAHDASDSLWVTSSTDGVNFAPAKNYPGMLLGSAPAMVASGNRLFIAFKAHDASDNLWVTSSRDGSSFSDPTNSPEVVLGSAPTMAMYGSSLFIAFKAHDASESLWVTSSENALHFPGATNSPNVVLGNAPAMALAPSGNGLFMALQEHGPGQHLFTTSSTNGITFPSASPAADNN